MSIWSWLRGADFSGKPVEGVQPVVMAVPKKLTEEELAKQAEEEAEAAKKRYERRVKAAKASFVSVLPAFKIVQQPEGHFEIQRRKEVVTGQPSPYDLVGYESGDYKLSYYAAKAKEGCRKKTAYDKAKPSVVEAMESVSDYDKPIRSPAYFSGYNPYSQFRPEYRTIGYEPVKFATFAEAGAYLFRLADPQAVTTEYDFPPLRKRAKPVAKKSPAWKDKAA